MAMEHRDCMVNIICRDTYHHDTKEFRARGHHYLCRLSVVRSWESTDIMALSADVTRPGQVVAPRPGVIPVQPGKHIPSRPGAQLVVSLLAKGKRQLPHDEVTMFAEDGYWPFEHFHRADGVRVLRFRCHRDSDLINRKRAIGCGRNVEAEEATVVQFVERLYEAAPVGTSRVFLDLVELERSLSM